jgi:hypothetical protein
VAQAAVWEYCFPFRSPDFAHHGAIRAWAVRPANIDPPVEFTIRQRAD